VADEAARLQLVERAEQGRPVLHAGALVELAAVAGDDTVLELAQANGVGALAEAPGTAHDVEQRLQGRLPQLGRYVVEKPIGGSGGGPRGRNKGIDGRGGRLYDHDGRLSEHPKSFPAIGRFFRWWDASADSCQNYDSRRVFYWAGSPPAQARGPAHSDHGTPAFPSPIVVCSTLRSDYRYSKGIGG